MNFKRISRRRLLRNATVAAALGSLGPAIAPAARGAESPPQPRASAGLNVRDFGAVGDDTAAFTAAMKKAADAGGDLVFVPRGNYLINGTLDVPEHVTLEGVFRAPTARTQNRGSTLLAVAGAGDASGQPFITLRQNATLHGLTVFTRSKSRPTRLRRIRGRCAASATTARSLTCCWSIRIKRWTSARAPPGDT